MEEAEPLDDLTYFLESRNGTPIMSLGVTAITQYHSLAREQECHEHHEPYYMITLTG